MSHRIYLFEPTGNIRRISRKLANDLQDGKATLSEYAGKILRIVFVFLEFENRKPKGIEKIHPEKWHFDHHGSIQAGHEEQMRLLLDLAKSALYHTDSRKNILDLSSYFSESRLKHRYYWEPTQEEIFQIMDLIWKPKKW